MGELGKLACCGTPKLFDGNRQFLPSIFIHSAQLSMLANKNGKLLVVIEIRSLKQDRGGIMTDVDETKDNVEDDDIQTPSKKKKRLA